MTQLVADVLDGDPSADLPAFTPKHGMHSITHDSPDEREARLELQLTHDRYIAFKLLTIDPAADAHTWLTWLDQAHDHEFCIRVLASIGRALLARCEENEGSTEREIVSAILPRYLAPSA